MQRIAQATRPALSLLGLGFLLASTAHADIETYNIDNAHSFANWEVRHIVAHTSGTFHDLKGTVSFDKSNIANSSVNASISVYSLNSSHLRRDVHALTEEFLDARNFPEMKFVSTSILPISAEKGSIVGQLTLHGITLPITMDYQILGFGPDPWGGMRAGFKAMMRINRSDFGITKFTPAGPVGNEVDITLLIEGIKLDAEGQPWSNKAAGVEKSKVISYPMPTLPVPQPLPLLTPTQPVVTPQPAAALSAEKKEANREDQLKKKLKDLLR